MRVIDLFSGAGGFSTGFQQAGFQVVAGNDMNRDALRTFSLNHPGALTFLMPCADLVTERVLPYAEVIIGGPPCQPFSKANLARKDDDVRLDCWREYLSVVKMVEPEVFVIENVQDFKRSEAFTTILDHSAGGSGNRTFWPDPEWGWLADYKVTWRLLNAKHYGVPQSRPRVFMIGARQQAVVGKPERVAPPGLKEVIGGLPPVVEKPRFPYTGLISDFHYDFTRDKVREVLSHIPYGGNWKNVPEHVLNEVVAKSKLQESVGGVVHKERFDTYQRLTWERPSRAIIATPTPVPAWAVFHPVEDRYLTMWERALIQTFPPEFVWHSNGHVSISKQIGNAVPPRLGYHLAKHIRRQVFADRFDEQEEEWKVVCPGCGETVWQSETCLCSYSRDTDEYYRIGE